METQTLPAKGVSIAIQADDQLIKVAMARLKTQADNERKFMHIQDSMEDEELKRRRKMNTIASVRNGADRNFTVDHQFSPQAK